MSRDAALQHGALRAVSELTFALYKLRPSSPLQQTLGEDTVARLLDIAPRVSLHHSIVCVLFLETLSLVFFVFFLKITKKILQNY